METLDADVAFLAKNQIMDYALILGVHNLEQGEKEAEEAALAEQLEDNEDEDAEDDEDAYDSGSGIPSALTPPDSPPFQVQA